MSLPACHDAPHATLYWRFQRGRFESMHQWAIRQRKLKLFKPRDGRPTLVDLAADPRETTDLSQRMPEQAQALERAWRQWNAQLADPAW